MAPPEAQLQNIKDYPLR